MVAFVLCRCPLEVGVTEGCYILITEMEEGSEKPEFWSALGLKANTRSLYCSHLTGKFTVIKPVNKHVNTQYHQRSQNKG
jgi:hypothetical protein